ncbi:MAG TPA: LuxR C-terminal-related transcriptional regulator [Solirubrobacterales bacterium]|jgi:predicted ATPase/DNA-binding CsgD family transcriptional regulator|nr:LuxR C-terminal-related transcriptional regulator [Solirubrobacterales bacterium]
MTTPFIGREAELAEIGRMLASERALTLTGIGGIGKTRLADEALARQDRAGRGATEVLDLGSVGTDSVAADVLAALGGREEPGREPLESIVARLGRQAHLVLFDDCDGEAEAIAALIETLIERCPGLRVLVTSRRPLGMSAERVVAVGPMSLPGAPEDLAVLRESEAVRLFLASAERSDPDFCLDAESGASVARICRGLSGIPLAIVLAASALAARPLEDVAADLVGIGGVEAADWQAGLRAAIDRSYRLLDPEGRRVFRRLGLLDGALREDVRALVAPARDDAAASIGSLLALGLIDARAEILLGEPRLRMLGPVRELALELLEDRGEAAEAGAAHLRHFAGLAASVVDLVNDVRGRRTLVLSAANLRAALGEAIVAGDPIAAVMCEQLTYWWFAADRLAEGRGRVAAVLARVGDADPTARALLLRGGALLAVAGEDYESGFAMASEALRLAERSGDRRAVGLSLQALNLVLGTVDPKGAAERGRAAVALLREYGDERGLGHALLTLAVAEALGDHFGAFDATRAQLMALRAARSDEWLLVLLDTHAAWARLTQGDPAAARVDSERVLRRLGEEISTRSSLARATRLQAMALAGDGAAALEEGLGEVERVRRAGLDVGVLILELALGFARLALGEEEAVRRQAEASLTTPALHAAVFWREALAKIALRCEDTEEVRVQAAAIREISERSGSRRQAALADYLDGTGALLDGDLEKAGALLHAALVVAATEECHRDCADVLEALGLLSAALGDHTRGLRLRAGAGTARRALGAVRVPPEPDWMARRAQESAEVLGAAGAKNAWADGERLTPADSIAYARRSRGKRRRALSGWASLTPAEREAAELAASGRSNPEIAERLLMSRGTVKAHLSRAYSKLGVANRTELAALVREELEGREVGAGEFR